MSTAVKLIMHYYQLTNWKHSFMIIINKVKFQNSIFKTNLLSLSFIFLSSWCWQRTRPRLQIHRILLHDFCPCCSHHRGSHLLYVSDKMWGPGEMLQVLLRLGEGGWKPELWNLLLCWWWREEAGCDGGSFWYNSHFKPSIEINYQLNCHVSYKSV